MWASWKKLKSMFLYYSDHLNYHLIFAFIHDKIKSFKRKWGIFILSNSHVKVYTKNILGKGLNKWKNEIIL